MNIEILESRIAPASVLTFTDVDGDVIKVTASRGDLTVAAVFANIGLGRQLTLLDLTDAQFQGANIGTSVLKGPNGDGFVNIGRIDATGRDLGSVMIKGDLGVIDAGAGTGSALRLLSVCSMGEFGVATQGGTGDLSSNINGGLGALVVSGDVHGAYLEVIGGDRGTIGRIAIGGSLVGGLAAGSGEIFATGNIGPVRIGHDVIGGSGDSSGAIVTAGTMGNVNIGGSVFGGAGPTSGELVSNDAMGAVTIAGSLKGGTGRASGFISAFQLASLTLGGSLLGGDERFSGSVLISGDIGPVKIAHNVHGGRGDESGKIDAGGSIASLKVVGSIVGGDGGQDTFSVNGMSPHTGQVFASENIGPVKIVHDVQGGSGNGSGTIAADGDLARITIGGSLVGSAFFSGTIFGRGDIGPVIIGHDVVGGEGGLSGSIFSDGQLGSLRIGGSLIGGGGGNSGIVVSGQGTGAIQIGHDLLGGSGPGSGIVTTQGKLTSIRIGGSLVGGSAAETGSIFASDIGAVQIGHDLVGGSISGTMATLTSTGAIISNDRIASVAIGGSIIAGIDGSFAGGLIVNATIRAGDDIGSVSVKGGLIGNVTPSGDSFVIVSARGQANPGTSSDVAIGKIGIGDRVEFAQILAGYGTILQPLNGDAQIGAVRVGGDWASSSMIAGAVNRGADNSLGGTGVNADNVNFGDTHDFAISDGSSAIASRIASVTVAGQVFGTPNSFANSASRFGFVAQQIGSLQIAQHSFPLHAGPENDGFIVGSTSNMTLHEVGALIGSTGPGTVPAAKLVNATTLTYTDADGDRVTVKLSRPLLHDGNVDDVFKFNVGTVSGGEMEGRQLQMIDLRVLASNGLSLTVSVKPGGGLADGLANIGFIDSTGFRLGSVSIQGDLGQIEAGTGASGSVGLAALSVRTLGRLDVDTQPAASALFTPDLESNIRGDLESLTVRADVAGASVTTLDSILKIRIGGSLIGGSASRSGTISASDTVGPVEIGAHLEGGAGFGSGEILSGAKTVSIAIGGSVIGSTGQFTGRLTTDVTAGPVSIAHNLLGGTGERSGLIEGNRLGAITIGGSLLGGAGSRSGKLTSYTDDIGAVKIGHNVRGGLGAASGKIDCGGALASLQIGGSLVGSDGDQNGGDVTGSLHVGQVFADSSSGPISIGHDIVGGSALFSGTVFIRGSVDNISIGGSIIGGSNAECGGVDIGGNVGAVKVEHDVHGSAGNGSGFIGCRGSIRTVVVGGSVIGGSISTTGAIFTSGSVGAIRIGHDMLGGTDVFSGYVQTGGRLTVLSIGGSVIGGSGNLSGRIFSESFGFLTIGRDLIGGNISGAAATLESTGLILSSEGIDSITIGGSIISGTDDSTNGVLLRNGSIRAGEDIGSLTIRGSLIGNTTAHGVSTVVISAVGQAAPVSGHDVAIGKLTVGGRVERALILAGYSPDVDASNTAAAAVNGNAQVGPVTVGGDWIASSLAAGVDDTGNNGFGNSDDSVLNIVAAARLLSVQIGGVVVGTDTAGDHFGFVAPHIDAFRSAGFVAVLDASGVPIELSLVTGDVTVRRL